MKKPFSDSVKEALSKDGIAIYPYDDIYTYVQTIPEEKKVFLSRNNVNSRLVSSIPKSVTILDGENLTLLPKAIKNETEVQNEKDCPPQRWRCNGEVYPLAEEKCGKTKDHRAFRC